MSEQTFLTREGLKKLEEELNYLRTVRRAQVAERLHNAQEDGELIENAEYEDAKNEQAFLEARFSPWSPCCPAPSSSKMTARRAW